MIPSQDSMILAAFEGSRNHGILWNLALRSTLQTSAHVPETKNLDRGCISLPPDRDESSMRGSAHAGGRLSFGRLAS